MFYKLNIFSKDLVLFKNYVNYVKLFSCKGELEIYFNHSPIIFLLKNNILYIYKEDINRKYFYISEGLLEFSNNKLTILIFNYIKFDDVFIKKINFKKENIINKLDKIKVNDNLDKFLYLKNKLLKYNSYLLFFDLLK